MIRTLFLLFIAGYTLRAMPFFYSVANTFDEQYARCSASLNLVIRAAWLAVAWITLETIVGWLLVSLARRRAAPKAPPTAPPSPA